MSLRVSLLALTAVLATAPAAAAGLEVHVADAATGGAAVTVTAGDPVAYTVVGEQGGSDTRGLAVILFDVAFDGGALGPVDPPSGLPMTSFLDPLGFDGNPFGFTGTPSGGDLLQVGGAQNVFAQGRWTCDSDRDCAGGAACSGGFCAPLPGLPGGELVLGVAEPGSPVVLARGGLTAPDVPGTYHLEVGNVRATGVAAGSNGDPFWVTVAVDPVTVSPLTIEVTEEQVVDMPAIPAVTPVGVAIMAALLLGAAVLVMSRRQV